MLSSRVMTLLAICLLPARATFAELPAPLLPFSEQMQIREQWLFQRHEMLLDMMRQHEVDMWIVVNEEFHDDPVTQFIAPPRPYTGGRDHFVFIDAGDAGLRAVAITGFAEERLRQYFESPIEPRPSKEVLPELYAEHQPQRIALNIGGKHGQQRGLTWDTYNEISEIMGEEATARFVSAADLIEEYLDTRIPQEHEHYTHATHVTEDIVRRALSNEAITPGVTTVGDVRNFLYDQIWKWGVRTWFQPDLRVQKRGVPNRMSRGFLHVADESVLLERGDVIVIDFGISYMGFDTDWQKKGYILREGETDAPPGLKAAMRNTNTLQDTMMGIARPGMEAGEVYTRTMAAMEEQGIQAQIYSHPVGNHGHGLGPGIDFRSAQRGDEAAAVRTLRPNSWISIELNTLTPVPEWDGQEVFIMMEDVAYLTEEGYRFFRPRQEAFFLIK
ncbi:M24 family metallopeptidase [Chromatocurvus halotolerans]|uniref:Xaa-Pro aminopeptidase n=1 Tax=Chromatocurvus halotolerans TaxID=1132028 RepID=A0A4R2KXJ0_9GAMM|nr:M24 family metallopeptidase [Chromatocurvus halotolerans]TCO76049.1 Xaa-Pro aminopeptidase [Chromatocurvus halotolerans]